MSAKVWIDAARPKTLGASLAPILIGAALAYRHGAFSPLMTFIALTSALCIQIGTNFCNDYCDFKKGADAQRVGPVRATQAGLIAPETMLRATVITFALAVALGAILVAHGGTPILIIGILSVAFGALYTAGPYPLAYIGLGDLFVLIFFGPVAVAGTYYVNALTWSSDAVILGLIPGLLAVGILIVNNLRDYESDRLARKRTLVVNFGERFGKAEYLACVVSPVIIASVEAHLLGGTGTMVIALLTALAGGFLAFRLMRLRGAALNPFLPATNILLIATSLLVALFVACPL
jgi:1,4-dihydroxy-2-naphthoate octaprenyltransferase